MYQKMSGDCKKSLKKQFDFSVPELDQIEKFISKNMGQTAKEILENLMEDDNLTDRQKVLASYILGTSVGAESATKDIETISSHNMAPVAKMQIGQGG